MSSKRATLASSPQIFFHHSAWLFYMLYEGVSIVIEKLEGKWEMFEKNELEGKRRKFFFRGLLDYLFDDINTKYRLL